MKRAFTLIELLVVVLIIGILAAIAVPQYRVAVLKARCVKAIVHLNALEKAQIAYKLANGVYADDQKKLDVEVQDIDATGWLLQTYASFQVERDVLRLEWVWPTGKGSWPNGQHRCIGLTQLGQQVCKSLGAVEMEHGSNSATTQFYRLP